MVDDFIKRKQGKKKIRYEIPQLQEILKETYGVIVYQEQVMKIANVVGGFSLGEADLLRRAMGKKKPEEMAAQKAIFMERATEKGTKAAKAEKIFDLMEYFAGYGFNKSHSAAYALITFQTAYLKTHHPAEFMTALLSCEMGNSDKVVKYITECRKMDIQILPPDVNESNKDFTVVSDGIRFGLVAIKNVGSGAIDSVLAVRQEEGRFNSLFDFCRKIDLRKTNKRVIEGLIKSGAFDSTKGLRAALMEHLEQAIQEGGQYQRVKETGQMTFFGDQAGKLESPAEPPLQQVQEWGDSKIAKLEKEALGFYITCHPLNRFEALMKKRLATPAEALESLEDNHAVRFCGMVVQEKVTITKRGDRMAYLRIEDLTGSVEVIVFPDLYQKTAPLFKQDIPLLFVGTVDRAEKGVKMKATAVVPLQVKTHVTILLSADKVGPRDIERLHQILLRFPGALPVYLRIMTPETSGSPMESIIAIDSKFSADGSDHLTDEIETCFGSGAVEGDGAPDANVQPESVQTP
jgi:DNA polymerase-3 subunit alpha